MNFSTPDDFRYLSGDLSSIVIDNDIMPKRASNEKCFIRGMDIAFLMEATEERRKSIDGESYNVNDDKKSFSYRILQSQLKEVSEQLEKFNENQKAENNISSLWLKNTDLTDVHKKSSQPISFKDAVNKLEAENNGFPKFEDITLIQDDIDSLYTYIKKLNYSTGIGYNDTVSKFLYSESPIPYKSEGSGKDYATLNQEIEKGFTEKSLHITEINAPVGYYQGTIYIEVKKTDSQGNTTQVKAYLSDDITFMLCSVDKIVGKITKCLMYVFTENCGGRGKHLVQIDVEKRGNYYVIDSSKIVQKAKQCIDATSPTFSYKYAVAATTVFFDPIVEIDDRTKW